MALEVTRTQEVLVRAPRSVPTDCIERFVKSHTAWIERQLSRMQERTAAHPEPTEEQARQYKQEARLYLPERVNYYSKRMNLFPAAVTITGAKTRFGSCSGGNRICFSWRLMAYRKEAIDYVVVHELAHIAHKNHGPHFYALIAEFLPDWKERKQLLT